MPLLGLHSGGEGDGRLHDELTLGSSLPRPVWRQPSAAAAIVVVVGAVFVVVVLVVGVGSAESFGAEGPLQPRRRRRPLPH